MIRSLTLAAALLWGGLAAAQTEPAPDDDVLSGHRVSFDALASRSIGEASQPVAFAWRRTRLHVAGVLSFPVEFNAFVSLRGGVLLRRPVGGALLELGVSRVEVMDSAGSERLGYTPFRQVGRPSRFELEFGVAVPVAEGVVTPRARALPSAQLTFNLIGSLRYLIYPGAQAGMSAGRTLEALVSPALSPDEITALNDDRLDAMQVDAGRYGLLLGFGNDLYFKKGLFVSPRVMVAVPLLAPATQTQLPVWLDTSVHVGWAF